MAYPQPPQVDTRLNQPMSANLNTPQRTLSSTIDKMYQSSDALAELVSRARQINSYMSGEDDPAKNPGGAEAPRPMTIVGSAEYLSMRFDSLINELARQLGRIDGALGSNPDPRR